MEVVPVRLEARRVRFRWSDTSPDFIPNDPFTSHTINVLHLLLPEGERWFSRVFRQADPLITSESLREDVLGFIKQESMHAQAHSAVLDHYAARGIDTSPFTAKMEFLFGKLLSDTPPVGSDFTTNNPHEWLVARIALIAAIEQFTTMLGFWVLDAKELDAANADRVMLDLLRWHGAEEVEHRSVAFDLFQHVSGDYRLRVAAMALVLPVFLGIWFHGTRFMLEADPDVPSSMRASELGLVPRFEWAARRTKRLPSLAMFFAAAGRFVAPSFHPSKEGSMDGAIAYLARSPAVAALRSRAA